MSPWKTNSANSQKICKEPVFGVNLYTISPLQRVPSVIPPKARATRNVPSSLQTEIRVLFDVSLPNADLQEGRLWLSGLFRSQPRFEALTTPKSQKEWTRNSLKIL